MDVKQIIDQQKTYHKHLKWIAYGILASMMVFSFFAGVSGIFITGLYGLVAVALYVDFRKRQGDLLDQYQELTEGTFYFSTAYKNGGLNWTMGFNGLAPFILLPFQYIILVGEDIPLTGLYILLGLLALLVVVFLVEGRLARRHGSMVFEQGFLLSNLTVIPYDQLKKVQFIPRRDGQIAGEFNTGKAYFRLTLTKEEYTTIKSLIGQVEEGIITIRESRRLVDLKPDHVGG